MGRAAFKSSQWGEDLGEGESIELANTERISLNPTFSRWEKEPITHIA